MIVRIITVKVLPGREPEFEQETVRNHEESVREPGVVRFDVLRDASNPRTYYLYEVYRDEQATLDHKETAHYHAWRQAVAEMMDGDRASVACDVIAPADAADW